jgi:hypothetical protein
MRRDSHAQWRELIATRLDRPLTRSESRYLAGHLKTCAACRQAEHDYREQRALLRALPPRIPPRDMWARTSAALDREVARGAYRGRGLAHGMGLDFGSAGRRGSPSAALLTTLATVGVVAALAVMQVMPATQVAPSSAQSSPPAVAAKATPFAVNPQPLAFIGSEAADVFLYQVDVAQACPQTEPDCEITESFVRSAVNLPKKLKARNASLNRSGRQLVFVGRASDRDVIAVVLLPSQPGDVPSATPSTTDQPRATGVPSTTPPETPTHTLLPGQTASAPAPSAVPGLTVLAILEDVHSAGAPPDWSLAGQTLAFSAMPADGSHGPDVYVWTPSDEHARAVTTDHSSYFASWSGERIVASRVTTADDGSVAAHTVVIDPLTLEERRVEGPRMWLPAVNPAGTHAVAWRGDFGVTDGLAVPLNGTLFMVDWASIDPFAPGAGAPTAEPTDEPTAEPTAEPSPTNAPSATADSTLLEPKAESHPSAAPTSAPSAGPSSPAEPTTLPETTPPETTPAETPPLGTTPPESSPPETSAPDLAVPLDLGREPATNPVLDWQARWSTDGQVLGIWIADAAGDTWGWLTVFAIDLESAAIDTGEPLLSLTFARRGFSLGDSRVAWVGAPDSTEGELHIATWGDDGVGGLRLQPAPLQEVVPAF